MWRALQKDVILVASFRFSLATVDSWGESSYKLVWGSIYGYFRPLWHDRAQYSREVGQASHLLSWLLQIRDSVYQLLRSCHFTQSERPKWPTTSTVDILCYLEWVPEIIQSSPATIFYQTCCNSFEILEIFTLHQWENLNLEREDLSSQSKLCHRSSCWVGPTMLLQSWLEYVFPDKIIEDPKAQRINRIRWCLFPIQETIARCF